MNDTDQYLQSELNRLQAFTKTCREDMHEPDEQDIHAEFGPSVVMLNGHHIHTDLDNANPSECSYDMGFWLIHRDGISETREWFNLANVIALARKAKL